MLAKKIDVFSSLIFSCSHYRTANHEMLVCGTLAFVEQRAKISNKMLSKKKHIFSLIW